MSTDRTITDVRAYDRVLPQYKTSFEGKILYANQALLQLLGYKSLDELMNCDVDDLYVDEKERDKWLKAVLGKGQVDMLVEYRRNDNTTVWVRDIAALPKLQDLPVLDSRPVNEVEGVLIPVDEEHASRTYHERFVLACDRMFEQAKVGIIKLDRSFNMIYASDYLRRLHPAFDSIVNCRMSVTSIVGNDGYSSSRRLTTAIEKMRQSPNETTSPVAVTMQLPGDAITPPTAVSIQFYHVDSSPPREDQASVICKIQDIRLSSIIEGFMREYGPRHPLFHELGVKTIIKRSSLTESHVMQFRFMWANEAFLSEVKMTLEDILGQTDQELFPQQFSEYHKRDTYVMHHSRDNRGLIQTIESHPTLQGMQEPVFVVKMASPTYDEVYVFYWSFKDFDSICKELSSRIGKLYVSILDTFPFPLFLRDDCNRFVYANATFCDHTGKAKSEIIGRTDIDIFPEYPDLTRDYLRVDEIVREMGRPDRGDQFAQDYSVTMEETNVDSTGAQRRVIVTKTATAINDDRSKLGVEGVFWAKHDIARKLAEGDRILRQAGFVSGQVDEAVDIFVSYAKEDKKWLAGDPGAVTRDQKSELMAALATLPRTDVVKYRSWSDIDVKGEWELEVESAMAQCKVGIILLSVNYLDKDGYAYNIEAPALLDRAENESDEFQLFVVELGQFPRIAGDAVLERLSRYCTVNRSFSDGRTVDMMDAPLRVSFWSRLVESAKAFLTDRNGR